MTHKELIDHARKELTYTVGQWDNPVKLVDELADALEDALNKQQAIIDHYRDMMVEEFEWDRGTESVLSTFGLVVPE